VIVWAIDTHGGELTITSNGASDAILWAYSKKAVLYAFDATKDVTAGPIWKQALPGVTPSWFWPTVVNGQVYVTTETQIYYFGLAPAAPAVAPAVAPTVTPTVATPSTGTTIPGTSIVFGCFVVAFCLVFI